MMLDKSQKIKLRNDPSSSQEDSEVLSYSVVINTCLSEEDFEDISSKIENRLSKRFRDTEFGQRGILRLLGSPF